MEKKPNIPKKGAARELAARLKELGKQAPPKSLVDKINNGEENKKKIANSSDFIPELDLE